MNFLTRLAYFVPCHRKPERCFHIKGEPLPICARCMSILLGFFFVPVLYIGGWSIPWWIGFVAQLPMLVDGVTQLVGWRESTNWLRTVTGLGSGFGLSVLVVIGSNWLVKLVTQVFAV